MKTYIKICFALLTILVLALPATGFAQLNNVPMIELSHQENSIVDVPTRMLVNRINHSKNMNDLEKYAEGSGGLHVLKNGQVMINLLIEASSASVENNLKNAGFRVSVNTGSIIAGSIEINNLKSLLETPGILRVELAEMKTLSHNQSLTDANVPPVHAGDQLSMPVTGAGVIVGIVDTGIDFTHPDFSDENGTRIQYLIDASSFDEEPTIWSKSDIDENPGAVWHEDYNGHGTHVTGTAAGNGSFSEEFRGIAFESDIIVAGLGNNLSNVNIITGVAAIKDLASQLGKPAVVNLSLGGHFSPHDGSSLFELAMTELADDGFIIVASAGNEALNYIHANAALLENESYEMNLVTQRQPLSMVSWFTNNSIEEVRLKVFIDPETLLDATDWVQSGSGSFFEIDYNEELFAEVQIEIDEPGNNDSQLAMQIMFDDETDFGFDPFSLIWVVELKTGNATGTVHSWTIGRGIRFHPLDLFNKGDSFIAGNNSYSIGSPATALNVISVGSYITKNQWIDINGNEQFVFTRKDPFFGGDQVVATVGNRSDFSSIGPTRDGRLAPIISAPGEMIFSVPSGSANNPENRINSDLYLAKEGTSMAAPHIAGIVALMLQVYPDMSYDEVVAILSATARKDEFTGSTENYKYGYGKIDAHAAVKLAAQLATNLPGETELPERITLEQNYPNPFNPITQIRFALPTSEHITLDVYNVLGQRVARLANDLFTAGSHTVAFDASNLASGMYVYRLSTENGSVLTRKMTLIK